MFFKLFLTSYIEMLNASSDIERIKYLPQRVEGGEFFNFKDKSMFGVVENAPPDIVIIDAERVNTATRYTKALREEYIAGFQKLLDSIDGDETDDEPLPTIYDRLYDIVEAGNKKDFRVIIKELKEKWFALDAEEIEDAIFDLADAVADGDVDFAKEVVAELGNDGDEPKKSVDKSTLTEYEEEIIEDLKSAMNDGDKTDIKELLDELKGINKDLYEEWKDKADKVPMKSKDTKKEEDVVDEIIADLDTAMANGDTKEAEECLEELADEVGKDSDIYKENADKIAPKKTRKRRR